VLATSEDLEHDVRLGRDGVVIGAQVLCRVGLIRGDGRGAAAVARAGVGGRAGAAGGRSRGGGRRRGRGRGAGERAALRAGGELASELGPHGARERHPRGAAHERRVESAARVLHAELPRAARPERVQPAATHSAPERRDERQRVVTTACTGVCTELVQCTYRIL
jgi:hypothetical protein